jgi:hypothetical protein
VAAARAAFATASSSLPPQLHPHPHPPLLLTTMRCVEMRKVCYCNAVPAATARVCWWM